MAEDSLPLGMKYFTGRQGKDIKFSSHLTIHCEWELWDSMVRQVYIHNAPAAFNCSTYKPQEQTQPRGNNKPEFLSTLMIPELAT